MDWWPLNVECTGLGLRTDPSVLTLPSADSTWFDQTPENGAKAVDEYFWLFFWPNYTFSSFSLLFSCQNRFCLFFRAAQAECQNGLWAQRSSRDYNNYSTLIQLRPKRFIHRKVLFPWFFFWFLRAEAVAGKCGTASKSGVISIDQIIHGWYQANSTDLFFLSSLVF